MAAWRLLAKDTSNPFELQKKAPGALKSLARQQKQAPQSEWRIAPDTRRQLLSH
jgi:hypothetical protein